MSANPKAEKNTSFANISVRVFITVMLVLIAVLVVCGGLSYCIPQGEFLRDETGVILPGTYVEGEVQGIAPWRVLTAPVRVFASEDAVTIIMISVFLLIMSGVFNLLEQTGGIRIFIGRIILRLRERGGPVICCTVLLFMLFGSFFGMFEELVTLVPLIVMFMLSLGFDTMTGLGACMMAACFGFSAAITNPFSVGLAAQIVDVPLSSGVWLRRVFLALVYVALCTFLMLHLRRIAKDPTRSPSYTNDCLRRESLESFELAENPHNTRVFRVYATFFCAQIVLLILIASIRAISSLAIPLLAVSFLVGGLISGLLVTEKKKDTFRFFAQGALSMLPAVLMIALASSIKLVMDEGGVIDTMTFRIVRLLDGKSQFVCILIVYFLILFLQLFIPSASAKIMLVMPIIVPICAQLGLSPRVVILAYCMADGFTDVILPTNPVLLVGLSMANLSYGKWLRWTWKFQLAIFLLTVLILFFAIGIAY